MSFPRGNNARCFLRHGAAFIVADLPRRWSSAVVSPPPRRRSSRVEEGWVEFFHRGGDRALFSLSASPGIPAAFLREKERKERKKIERSTRRLLHKCIAAIGDIIREARRKVQSNIFVFRCFPFTFEREPLVHGLDSPVPGSVNPDGGWEGRLVYRHRTISRRFGDSVSYSEQRSLHPPILASTR